MEDKNHQEHRVRSASAAFQKGIYHLFMLKQGNIYDAFDNVLRRYQSVFLLGVTELLLDFAGIEIEPKPPFADKDPAAGVQHKMIKNWSGFGTGHPLHQVSQETRRVFASVIDARHNLIYRPFYLRRSTEPEWYWENCVLQDLLKDIPSIDQIQGLYRDFFQAMGNWENNVTPDEFWIPNLFFIQIVNPFSNSNQTLLVSYAHLLNPENSNIANQVQEYSFQLLGKRARLTETN